MKAEVAKVYFPVMSGANHGITGKWIFSIDRFSRASLETLIRQKALSCFILNSVFLWR